MADLKVKYLGLELKNPIVAGACNLTADVNNLKRMQDAGVAAIVFKSLFEEQIQLEALQMENHLSDMDHIHAEMTSLFPKIEHAGPADHLLQLSKAKKAVQIPVIASLNAVLDDTWVEYAKKIEATGVDALELNFYSVTTDFNKTETDIIAHQIHVIKEVKNAVKIPVSVKLSSYYANVLNVVKQMEAAGANGVVLFNRLFQPDIDIDKEAHHFPWNLSNNGDYRTSLRFAGLLHSHVKTSVITSTGVLSGSDAIQLLLAGADAVQVVSTLYRNKIESIGKILTEISEWMHTKGYNSVAEFQGKLSEAKTNDPFAYTRAQYVDILLNSQNIFEKFNA